MNVSRVTKRSVERSASDSDRRITYKQQGEEREMTRMCICNKMS